MKQRLRAANCKSRHEQDAGALTQPTHDVGEHESMVLPGVGSASVSGLDHEIVHRHRRFRSSHNEVVRTADVAAEKYIGAGREVAGLRQDGTTLPMDVSVSETHLGNRRIFTALVRDLTETKRAENALRESQKRLLHAQKMEALGRLTGGITHDFRNLLMGIMGCCRLAEDSLASSNPARLYIEEIIALAETGSGLINSPTSDL